MPVSEEVPLTAFTQELKHALSAVRPALLLTSGNIKQRLGSAALDSIHEYQLAGWDSRRIFTSTRQTASLLPGPNAASGRLTAS